MAAYTSRFLGSADRDNPQLALQRSRAYLNASDAQEAQPQTFTPSKVGFNAFAGQFGAQTEARQNALGQAMAARLDYEAARDDSKSMLERAKIARDQQKKAAAQQNRGGLFGTIGRVGGALLGSAIPGVGTALGGAIGGGLGSLFG